MQAKSTPEKRISRWYFGGLASSGAAMVTHPLDLLKVSEISDRKLPSIFESNEYTYLTPFL